MCGIAGLLRRLNDQSDDALRDTALAMAAAIAHRGPDDFGAWTDAAAGVALSHRRLSILDLSPLGHQPMLSRDERWVLSFNGEIYNFLELRQELEALGHTFRGHSDTEVLLAGVVEWGIEQTLRRSNGMLAIALWDRQTRTLTLARDRLGKKPLYYGWFGSTLLFASELKALFAHPDFRWDIDRDALGLFIQHGWLPNPHSIFQTVRKLPPATLLTIDSQSPWSEVTPVPYWSAREASEKGVREPFAGTEEQATDQLEMLLRDCVERRMIADVSLGALLSGGIDSSTVVALMQSVSTSPVKTFCIGFHEDKYNEAHHAAAVARHLATDHTELYVSPAESRDVIPRLPELYDEPFADDSQIPTFIVSQLARRDVTVALTGDGGDELFAGYSVYARCLRQYQQWRHWPVGLRHFMARNLDRAAGAPLLADPAERDGRLSRGRRQKLAAKLAKRAALMSGDTPIDILTRKRSYLAEVGDVVPGAASLPFILNDPSRWIDNGDPLQRMQHVDIEGYLTDDVLVKVDRASMAVALEIRSPLLDYRVLEFALTLPRSMRIGPGGGKRVLRNVLARYVPPAITERKKAGFGAPLGEWLRGPLREWGEALIAPGHVTDEGLLDARNVGRIWRQHLSGSHNHERLLWGILMFRAWHDHWRELAGTPNRLATSATLQPATAGAA